jgi:hypothetical protein
VSKTFKNKKIMLKKGNSLKKKKMLYYIYHPLNEKKNQRKPQKIPIGEKEVS